MNKYTIFLYVLCFSCQCFGQETYFQQNVHYDIEVVLNDTSHLLEGTISMKYTNNSPDDLSFLYMHLWPNAYKSQKSAFAKQKLEDGNTRFHYATEKQKGYIDGLDFQVEGKSLTWSTYDNHPDIAVVNFTKPLKSGATTTIKTPFRVKIPDSFSRLGHVSQSYQITQWYPKPAVYDQEGWHPMPYLDQGEFYSEFGSFDVKITLPKNYIVGATGVLQTESELEWLNELAPDLPEGEEPKEKEYPTGKKKHKFPASSKELKTIHYTAENIHDFAWFADKRFHVRKSQVTLKSGRKVDTWAMFTDFQAGLWEKATLYLDRSVQFYSDKVGEYPYPQATAVQSALSAGAGMEYPMITVIGRTSSGKALDNVITHEVGHNWFYGILGSNERDNPWMDEGLNSYIEGRYMQKYYSSDNLLENVGIGGKWSKRLGLENYDMMHLVYLLQARQNKHQCMGQHSEELTPINYFLSGYGMVPMTFGYLEHYIGEAEMDRAMNAYYEKWKFKHPQPADVKVVFEEETGKDLSWLFKDIKDTKWKIDYALKKAKDGKVTVKNKGNISSPFSISGVKNDSIISTKWYEGFEGEKTIDFPTKDYDMVMIDGQRVIPEINRKNNRYKLSGALKKTEKFKFKILGGFEQDDRTTLYYTPLITGNKYDKMCFGLALYNSVVPTKKFEFMFAPMYSIATNKLVGVGDIQYSIYPNKGFHRIVFGLNARSFNSQQNFKHQYHLQYIRLAPRLRFELAKKRARSRVSHAIEAKSIVLMEESSTFDLDGNFFGKEWNTRNVHSLTYELSNKRSLHPFDVKASVTGEGYEDAFTQMEAYVKATVEANFKISFKKKGKSLNMRVFAGQFLYNSDKDFGAYPLSLIGNSASDFTNDEFFFGRSEQRGIWSNQVSNTQGGFKTPIEASIGGNGRSNSTVIALNIKSDLPFKLPLGFPLKPYLDIGYAKETQPSVSSPQEFYFSGGAMLDFRDGIFAVYFPLFSSENLDQKLKSKGNYLSRIAFTLDINRLNPKKSIRNISDFL